MPSPAFHNVVPWRMKNADGSDYYNEVGKTWYAVPVLHGDEYGNRYRWFVANVDAFDEQHLTGEFIATCESEWDAQQIVVLLNAHGFLKGDYDFYIRRGQHLSSR